MNIMGSPVEVKISSTSNGGAYFMFHITVAPGEGVPPHTHTIEDEMFYILEGELSLLFGGKSLTGIAGQGFLLPRNVPHGYVNRSGETAKMLVTVSPGHSFEAFFTELDALTRRGGFGPAEVGALALRFGMSFMG